VGVAGEESDAVNFGEALNELRDGQLLTRDGWPDYGKGRWIVLQAGYPDGIAINANTAAATGIAEGTVCRFQPYLMLKTSGGDFVPWVAAQTDLLADDWRIVN